MVIDLSLQLRSEGLIGPTIYINDSLVCFIPTVKSIKIFNNMETMPKSRKGNRNFEFSQDYYCEAPFPSIIS